MIAAAAMASSTVAAPTAARASASTASRSRGLRAATAAATATPQRCASPRLLSPSTAWTLSARSRAGAGIASRAASRALMSGRLQRRLALVPVAGAELVGLQSVEHAQHLVHVAPDVEVGHRDEPDDPLRVDDERRPHRHPGRGVQDPE